MPNPIKPTIKTEILSVALLVLSGLASIYFYSNFPESVPTHWNFEGVPDGYSSAAFAAFAAFFFPALLLGIYLLLLFTPMLDPKKERYEQFRKIYHIFKGCIVLFMVLIYFLTGLAGLGYAVDITLWVTFFVGILFLIIGNYMPKIKMNWFMGIRTPWTLSSEEVWNKTHRLGAKLFILAGILMMIQSFLPASFRLPLFFAMIGLLTLGTFGYSYYLYNKEKENDKHNQ